MTSTVAVGVLAIAIGILAFWQRERVSRMAIAWNKRQGKLGEALSEFASPKAYGISGLLMATGGLVIVVYTLVTGDSLQRTGESEALAVIVITAILTVVLLSVGAVMMYRRRRK